jgi:ribosomal protein S18 acetylase RimI-like enzyme
MMDDQLPNVSVWMFNSDLTSVPRYALPEGYRMRFYREGDVAVWVRIQQAADEFIVPTAETFARSIPGEADYLAQRVMFLVDPAGTDIGTITAWNSSTFQGREMGQIHWVAIIPEAQGRGLAKPMLSAACDLLRERGYREAWLETGTGRIAALNLYLRFGFVPHPRDENERAAWQAAAPRLKFPIEL